jgi:hypothetical protein
VLTRLAELSAWQTLEVATRDAIAKLSEHVD